jgi:hypothetical protein
MQFLSVSKSNKDKLDNPTTVFAWNVIPATVFAQNELPGSALAWSCPAVLPAIWYFLLMSEQAISCG